VNSAWFRYSPVRQSDGQSSIFPFYSTVLALAAGISLTVGSQQLAAQVASAPAVPDQASKARVPSAARVSSLPKVKNAAGTIVLINGMKGKGATSFTYVDSSGQKVDLVDLIRGDTSRLLYDVALSQYDVHYLEIDTAAQATIAQLTEDAEAALTKSGVLKGTGPINLVGHSAGGLVAMGLNRRLRDVYGDRMSGVIMMGTPLGGVWRSGKLRSVVEQKAGEYMFGKVWNSFKDLDQNDWLQEQLRDLSKTATGPVSQVFVGCAYEEHVTYFKVTLGFSRGLHVVPRDRVVLGQGRVQVCEGIEGIAQDHYNIAKPRSRSSEMFVTLRAWIAKSHERWTVLQPRDLQTPVQRLGGHQTTQGRSQPVAKSAPAAPSAPKR
jgi:pimeloyl-ACP methyl ester carboxylesterase